MGELQPTLPEMLALLAAGARLPASPALSPVAKPRTFLPSVDRPWPLDLQRLVEVYKFIPTPLDEVLRICATFAEACSAFPSEARKAARKLPKVPSQVALARADLQ